MLLIFFRSWLEIIERAKADLAEISKSPLASKLLNELHQMEGLDPYISGKLQQIEKKLKETRK